MEKQNSLSKNRNICELLAPAGSKEAFIAAVESGADAVYAGGNLFNARINAHNFELSEIEEAVRFAHKRNVKVYITINVLIKDEELLEALEYAKNLYEIGVDAIIVQDIGFANLVRKHLTGFELHMSTQASVFDKDGVFQAMELGFSRVVPARELSLAEIETLCKETPCEIEVFCHGAICVCYSGQCQMSRYIGGRSGNRGGCAQPCRLPYKSADRSGGTKETALLSPSDMSMIDHLDKLCEAGVRSLKIEGRMKSPEYVAVVTSIYRKYLDIYAKNGSYELSEEDRLALTQIFNRGFTSAYLNEQNPQDFMSGEISKHKGIEIGKVLNANVGRNLIKISSSKELRLGDGIEIRGKNIRAGNVVTYLKEDGKGIYIVGDIKDRVEKSCTVYRITSKDQIELAANSYKNKDWNEGKFLRKAKINIECNELDGKIQIRIRDENEIISVVNETERFEPAETSARERIAKALTKLGGSPFNAEKIDFNGEFCLRVQMSELNKLRRETLSLFESALCEGRNGYIKKGKPTLELPSSLLKAKRDDTARLEMFFYSLDEYKKFDRTETEAKCAESEVELSYLIPAADLVKEPYADERIIPYISNISKGKESEILSKNEETLWKLASKHGIYIGNLGTLAFIKTIERKYGHGESLHLYADYGFNVYNEETIILLQELGAERVIDSLETGGVHYGALPLMVSEHGWDESEFIDRKSKEYKIIKRDISDQDIIAATDFVDISACIREAKKQNKTVRIYVN